MGYSQRLGLNLAISVFSELLSLGYSFLHMLRLSGCGGGLAKVYRQKISYRFIPFKIYSSFEPQVFVTKIIPIAHWYCPPKYNKEFISKFSDFLFEIMLKYDSFVIFGDLNIHLCCPSSQLFNYVLLI